jgi:hypothetical protein
MPRWLRRFGRCLARRFRGEPLPISRDKAVEIAVEALGPGEPKLGRPHVRRRRGTYVVWLPFLNAFYGARVVVDGRTGEVLERWVPLC